MKTLSDIELLALAKAVNFSEVNDESVLAPKTSASVNFWVHVEGEVSRGNPAKDRTGTNYARSVPNILLLLEEMGVTRNHAPRHIMERWAAIGSMTKKQVEAAFVKGSPEEQRYQEMNALFTSEILDKLPRIPAKATVKADVTLKKK